MYSNEELEFRKKSLEDSIKYEKGRLAEARRKRNAAAMVDFASALLNIIGHEKGARYTHSTNAQDKYRNTYEQAQQRYCNAMRDYKAKIAEINLKQKMGQADTALSPLKTVGFITQSRLKPVKRLANGTLEKVIKNFSKQ
jgi:hypothetical protein